MHVAIHCTQTADRTNVPRSFCRQKIDQLYVENVLISTYLFGNFSFSSSVDQKRIFLLFSFISSIRHSHSSLWVAVVKGFGLTTAAVAYSNRRLWLKTTNMSAHAQAFNLARRNSEKYENDLVRKWYALHSCRIWYLVKFFWTYKMHFICSLWRNNCRSQLLWW